MTDRHGFVVAGVTSGSGKTTVTNGLLRALERRGMRTAPFKTGPDFIDTLYHRAASGHDSINLDVFMSDERHVKELYARHSAGTRVSVVEGVMGLFDGYDLRKGSTAHIASLTGLPVLLVVNAASAGYSLAPLLKGYREFDPSVRIAGVVFNNVASEMHLDLLLHAAEDAGVRSFGYLKKDPGLSVTSRHLGLCLDNAGAIVAFADRAADVVERSIDIDDILEATALPVQPSPSCTEQTDDTVPPCRRKRIAVACDEAFNFIYPENLRSLERDPRLHGEIIRFSPMRDNRMPDADFLWLPGGYPELYAAKLADNRSMRRSVRNFVESGGRALAECGGMLYLTEQMDGHEMCGVIPATATMKNARLHLGYRTVRFGDITVKGHEFHYSSVVEDKGRIGACRSDATQTDAKGRTTDTPVYRIKNLIAGYTHLYWGHRNISDLWS